MENCIQQRTDKVQEIQAFKLIIKETTPLTIIYRKDASVFWSIFARMLQTLLVCIDRRSKQNIMLKHISGNLVRFLIKLFKIFIRDVARGFIQKCRYFVSL